MSWRGAACRSLLGAVRGRAASSASRILTGPLPSAPRRGIPTFSPLATARPLVAMMGSLAASGSLTGHSSVNAGSCCELSQGTTFCRTCQDR